MQQVKVLHFIPGFRYGGIENTTINLFKNIDSSKVQIDILVESHSGSEHLEKISSLGCKVYKIEKFDPKYPFKYYRSLIDFFKQHKEYQIVHSYNISRTPFLFLAAKKSKIKHRIFHASTTLSSTKILKRVIFRILIKISTLLSTRIFACSEKASRYFFKNKKAVILKNGIETEKFIFNNTIRKRIRNELNIENKFVIGHVGRFCEAKNHSFILDIFNEICKIDSNTVLLLIGDGPLEKEIVQKISRLNLRDRVILTGAIINVNDYLQAMDIFIFPSLYEGFGNAAIEAQAAGLKVIASDRVPQDVKITDLVEFISLKAPLYTWTDSILKERNNSIRRNTHNEVILSGYDIVENAKFLEKYYLKMALNKNN